VLLPATSEDRMAIGNDTRAAAWGVRTAVAIARVR